MPAKLNPLLRMAVLAGVETAVRLHIRRGDDLDAVDDAGMTPLMLAASRDKASICSLLLEAGADPNLTSASGSDALALARKTGATSVVSLLESIIVPDVSSPVDVETENMTSAPDAEISENNGRQTSSPFLECTQDTVGISGDEWLDLADWEAEEDLPAPMGDASLIAAAVALNDAISTHKPVDTADDWGDFEAFLPERSAPFLRDDVTEGFDRIRALLLRGLKEGSVPERMLISVCGDEDGTRDENRENLLRLILGDIGAETDERVEDGEWVSGHDWNAEEAEDVEEALSFLNAHGAGANDPLYAYMKDMRREQLLTEDEETCLGREMEEAFNAALDVLSQWPDGITTMLSIVEQVGSWESGAGEETKESWSDQDPTAAAPTSEVSHQKYEDSPDRNESSQANSRSNALVEKFSALALPIEGRGAVVEEVKEALSDPDVGRALLTGVAQCTMEEIDDPAASFREAVRRHVKARERMVLANMRLVFSIAKRYQSMGLPIEDLIQEGNLGLMKAVDRYDWRKGFRFSTYATWWIRQQITRALADKGRTIRVPKHINDKILQLKREADSIGRMTCHGSTTSELSARLGITESKAWSLMARGDEPISLEDLTVESIPDEQSTDPLQAISIRELRIAIERALADLDSRTAEVLSLRVGLIDDEPMTLDEIGSKYGFTRERARQIELQGLTKLQHPVRRDRLSGFLDHLPRWRTTPGRADRAITTPLSKHVVDKPATKESPRGSRVTTAPDTPAILNKDDLEKIARSRKQAIDQVVAAAKELGVTVMDRRPSGGPVEVRMAEYKDSKKRKLARTLLEKGFKLLPGGGFIAYD